MKIYIRQTILTIAFIVLIQWIVDFRFFQLEDLRIMAVLAIGTTILLLLTKSTTSISGPFRFYLIFTALIMSLFMMYDNFYNGDTTIESVFIRSIKPFLYAVLLYVPGNHLIKLYQSRTRTSSWVKELSRREMEVYELVLKGLSNKDISAELFIAEGTVKKHVQSILKKADVKDRYELIDSNKSKIS